MSCRKEGEKETKDEEIELCEEDRRRRIAEDEEEKEKEENTS